jgi:hypothetical protein
MNEMKPPAYRVNLKLDPVLDADLIAWLENLPRGTRSRAVRERLRQATPVGAIAGLEDIRQVLVEELAKIAISARIAPADDGPAETQEDVEARYGSRLDRMMGGLAQGRSASDGEG